MHDVCFFFLFFFPLFFHSSFEQGDSFAPDKASRRIEVA